jgi:hypothetical protein
VPGGDVVSLPVPAAGPQRPPSGTRPDPSSSSNYAEAKRALGATP